jgi:thioredoxin reductase (NADPH)
MPGFEIEDVDALIIGGGRAGLTCAIYLARYRRKVIVIDSMNSRAALIPETHNYPGFADGIAGPRLLDALTVQAKVYGVSIIHERVIGDVVSDLHQIAVATGHAAVAATHVHNNLPRNFR